MSPLSFILLVVLIVVIAKTRHGKLRGMHRRAMFEDGGEQRRIEQSERERQLQREVEELRERVKVLERIATDDRGSRSLAAEIEKLRDED